MSLENAENKKGSLLAGRSSPDRTISDIWPEYLGVCCTFERWRVVVSATGKRYVLQEPSGNSAGTYRLISWGKSLSALSAKMCALGLEPVSFEGFAALPENPMDFPLPWRERNLARLPDDLPQTCVPSRHGGREYIANLRAVLDGLE